MASPVPEQRFFSDVRQVGYLRKPKSMHKRFFVLRAATPAGPSRLEYYENEKKWRHKSGVPKRSILLDTCFNINKRADSKNKYLVALYTKDDSFSIAAESEQEQDVWYQALVDLHNRGKVPDVDPGDVGTEEENYGKATPGPAFKEVWQVVLKPKGLGHTKNLIGIYRLCLTNKTISFVKLNSDAAAVVLQLMNVRRCGHSENFFFIEVGRSAVTGPGEFWMQVDDSVVAQNMHETILEAMKAMSEEFRPRSKSQSSSNCSNPISVPLRRHHHHNNPPPSQVGLGRRRSRGDSVSATSPAAGPRHSQSFRVRASSDGEGTMSRPASVDGSPATAAAARTQSHRHRGGGAASAPLRLLHPPLNHSRSIPTPSSSSSSCCPSPSATSPVSLASSAHSSASDGPPFSGARCASGSPSDGGFLSSSDEYGSSPCDFRSSFRSVTPDSPGRHTPPAREEELNNYISMARHAGHSLPRGAAHHASCPDEPELEMCFRKLMHPSGTPPPPPPTTTAVCHQKTPSQSSLASLASLEEYTVMSPAHPGGRGESVGGGYGRQPACSAAARSSSSVVRSESLCVGDYSNARTEASRPGLSDRQTTPSASVSDVVIAAAAAPYSVSSGEGEAPGAAGPGPLRCGLTGGPLPGLSAFTRVSWNQGARVVRADQQGRRRHSSETFSSTPRSKGAGGGGGGATPVGAAEEVKRHSSASFESVWLKPAESPAAGGKTESSARADSQNQNGLNYIDLDLSRDTPPLDRGSGHAHREDKGSSSAEDLSAYARISFHNADDLWGKPSYREE